MKKYLVLFLLTSSCTHIIIDPRGSKEPREIVRDEIECKKIIKDKKNWSLAERQYAKMIRKRLKSKDETVER